MTLACIFGCAGPELTRDEAAFFRAAQPWGFILFRRNIEEPAQLKALVASLRAAIDQPEAPVLVDQEGGRVQRMAPPQWRRYPPAGTLAALDLPLDERATLVRLCARLIAHDLSVVGVDVDCAPVLDVPIAGAHDIIGDRAYGDDPAEVAVLGRAAAEGLLAGGVLPVIKHIPGHGRARSDSHVQLPRVEAGLGELRRTDIAPFRALSDMPIAMTAHVVYAAIDPERPCTTSGRAISTLVRGEAGFEGLLLSDDLSMQALSGALGERASSAITAGCDIVLHCNGDQAEMRQVAERCGDLQGAALARARAALARRTSPTPFDPEQSAATLEAALAAGAMS